MGELAIKFSQTIELNMICLTNKLPRFWLYHQGILVNMNFLTGKDALLEKQLLEKPATIKIFSGEFEKAN